MRILWSSNAPWVPSGYGQQTKLTVPQLQRLGHDVAIDAFCGLQGGVLSIDGVPIYPSGGHQYGCDTLAADAADFKADIAITLIDAWVYHDVDLGSCRWVPYFPVDSEPIAPILLNSIKRSYDRIVFSKHAMKELDAAGLSYKYVPHMIDTEVMKPKEETRWRESTGTPEDAMVFGMVAANNTFPSRKAYPQVLEAFIRFHADVPNSRLYIHARTAEHSQGGTVNMPAMLDVLCKKYGVNDSSCVFWIDPYVLRVGAPPEYMADMYNGIDVLLSPSMGEGFGIPILEAQACGTPVIIGDWTAMPDIFFAGWKVERAEAVPFWISGYDTYFMLPSVEGILRAMREAYEWKRSDRTALKEAARAGAVAYDCVTVADNYWKPALDDIHERIKRGYGEFRMVKM